MQLLCHRPKYSAVSTTELSLIKRDSLTWNIAHAVLLPMVLVDSILFVSHKNP